jgi:hypothetical protein
MNVQGDRRNKKPYHDEEDPTFGIFSIEGEVSPDQSVMERKIDARKEHEYDDDAVNVWAVVSGDTRIFWGKPTGGHGAEGMVDRFKKRHVPQEEENNLNGRDQEIYLPEGLGGF